MTQIQTETMLVPGTEELDIPDFLKVENREMDFEPEEGEMFLQSEDEVGSEDDDED